MAGTYYRHGSYLVYCQASGFKCHVEDTVIQWDGRRVLKRFAEKRNEQDFLRGRKDDQRAADPRPEPTDAFLSAPVLPSDL